MPKINLPTYANLSLLALKLIRLSQGPVYQHKSLITVRVSVRAASLRAARRTGMAICMLMIPQGPGVPGGFKFGKSPGLEKLLDFGTYS
jgi:hypothetical protein